MAVHLALDAAWAMDTARPVLAFLLEYGYVALFLVFILEGAMLLYVAPSESLVPVAVASPLASSVGEYALVIGVAVAGATVGQVLLFLVAKRGGRPVLQRYRWMGVTDERLDRYEGWFTRWGPVVIPVSNTLLFTRGMLTIPAGLAGMDTRRFLVLSAVGTLVFETALAAVTLGVIGLWY